VGLCIDVEGVHKNEATRKTYRARKAEVEVIRGLTKWRTWRSW